MHRIMYSVAMAIMHFNVSVDLALHASIVPDARSSTASMPPVTTYLKVGTSIWLGTRPRCTCAVAELSRSDFQSSNLIGRN